jgi:GT2 family glycosyltransferase
MPELSIVIPTCRRGEIFRRTLQVAVEALKNIDAEIIIVNDAPDEPLNLSFISSDKIIALENVHKQSVASARNLGARHARSSWLLFLDDDFLITENSIREAMQFLNKHPHAAVNVNWEYPQELLDKIKQESFGRYLIHFGFTSMKGWSKGLTWDDEKPFLSESLASFFMMHSKDMFEKSGGYDENFEHSGFEDWEYVHRLQKLGVEMYVLPQVMIWHNEADRTAPDSWLDRKVRAAHSRRAAVAIGYSEKALYYSLPKRLVYNFIIITKPFWLAAIAHFPNWRLLDLLYFRFLNLMLGASLYEGYSQK